MNEKTKKRLVIAGLAVVCIGLVLGISSVLYREPEQEIQVAGKGTEDAKVTVGTWSPEELPTEDEEEAGIAETGTETGADIEAEQDAGTETRGATETEQGAGTDVNAEAGAGAETDANEDETLRIEVETKTAISDREQELQPVPEKTEDEKPQEPPALTADAENGNPNVTPAYEEPQEKESPAESAGSTPSNGEEKDGMIYIDGFGWIPNEGGGGSGTVAGDMYENGNKIGSMD